ncbi:LPS O-antigen chain length determinant protein WzzB [Pusillimonas noertemannii]|uniref:LPS O-antigen chain length determinant protein WzzB n=1 Tax=Pusillimonas noertemannii TaxID=305977 RepID=UPI0015D0914A|nr:Wzz/FepE/Etk N-terminal domain-containing protein [Pusillimonas noertemannii]
MDNHYPTDEINLNELVQALWSSKWMIIAFTLVTTCIAAAYAFFSTPIYRTTVQTLPPTASGLASYNVASQLTGTAIRGIVSDTAPGIEPLTPTATYQTFLRYLNSNTIRQSFFDKYYLPAQPKNETEGDKQRAWKNLNDELRINLPRKPDEYEAGITLEGANPKVIAEWANAFVELAVQAAREDLLNGLAGEVKIREQSLQDQIATLRDVAKDIRLDRIIRLQNALTIAENIGLESPADNSALVAITAQGLNTENVNTGSLLYLRGSKALRSELEQLEQRKMDDAYIAELPDLLKKQALLKGINLNPELLSVATIDRTAIAPEDPVKPNKLFSLAFGFILGGVLSVLWVLIRLRLRAN